MKIDRNFRYVLTVVTNAQTESVNPSQRTGEKLYESECHYYAEKEILSNIKEAAKSNRLDEYRGNVYAIYKETKPVYQKETREDPDGTKVTIERPMPTTAILVETIKVVGDRVEVR